MLRPVRNALIFLHLIAIIIGSLPTPVTPYKNLNRIFSWTDKHLKVHVWHYLYGFGIGQNWEMFNIVDHYDDTWFDATLTDSTGRVKTVTLIRTDNLNPLEKLSRMRELFFFETVTGTSNQFVLKNVANYLAREEERAGGKKIQKVEIRNRWRPVYIYVSSENVPFTALTAYETKVDQIP
jgi:hypothetical protein